MGVSYGWCGALGMKFKLCIKTSHIQTWSSYNRMAMLTHKFYQTGEPHCSLWVMGVMDMGIHIIQRLQF